MRASRSRGGTTEKLSHNVIFFPPPSLFVGQPFLRERRLAAAAHGKVDHRSRPSPAASGRGGAWGEWAQRQDLFQGCIAAFLG